MPGELLCAFTRSAGRDSRGERSDVVVDGRFKGGWITRHFGRPESGVHAVQMELACRGYMIEPRSPGRTTGRRVDEVCATPTRTRLRALLAVLLDWTQSANP